MPGLDTRIFLVFRRRNEVVHEEELDLNSLVHDVAFAGVVRRRLPNDGRWEPVEVEPAWRDGKLDAVTVRVAGFARRYEPGVFTDRATEILRSKEIFDVANDDAAEVSWELEVRSADEETERKLRHVRVRHQAYPIVQRNLAGRGTDEAMRSATATVLVSDRLLAELRGDSAASLERERADFLAGHLVRGEDDRIFVLLLDRVAATLEAGSSLVHFSFSPHTFLAAQRELRERRGDQVILGWHHNHPPPCGRKCLTTEPPCRTDNVMFSLDDRIVHRSAFSLPYMVGLVSGKGADRRADDPLMRAYGWQRGLICEHEWSLWPAES
jgi:hypothetical protein